MSINIIGHLDRAVSHERLQPLGRRALLDTPKGEEVAQCVRAIFCLPAGVDYLGMALNYIERALQTAMTGDRTTFARDDEI
jgi:hypothetical protein